MIDFFDKLPIGLAAVLLTTTLFAICGLICELTNGWGLLVVGFIIVACCFYYVLDEDQIDK